MKTAPVISTFLVASLLVLFGTHVQAQCKASNIQEQLDAEGWTSEFSGSEDGIATFAVKKNGSSSQLFVELDDGDIGLRDWFSGDDFPLSDINHINQEFKYLKLSRDSDGDLRASMDYPFWAEGCPSNVSEIVGLWFSGLESAIEALVERMD